MDFEMTDKPISVHPLAVVNMTDQYTRVRCGSSALPSDAPVMGLLLGADGIIYDSHELSQTDTVAPQVALHQAVFPQHQVVGWYRVASEPGPEDYHLTQQLQSLYAPQQSFVLALLTVEDEESSKELPLSFFQLGDCALLALEKWELSTNPAERIALEHSVRSSEDQRSSLQDLQHAYAMIQERLMILEQYLLQEGPQDPEILRQIQSLFLSAPVAAGGTAKSSSTTMMAQLATWTRMTDAILSYTGKIRALQDAATSNLPRGGDSHRFGLMSQY
ncbi:hypothetical protein FisN_18Lh134 [Fistulifera solaris]|uniref:EIF3F/CSN6-like C-terminal domain-containing protein n=1 Tax=Fistulifera solaris TaxID=1519565 RepID=A0A1Z5KFP8_FISSO|nr:hypothetical protein FisN_18Lh134 [Fistulifera solaris]|eukprot:GAX24788.1 hypothetical protein FisN_18Lh134 [Fistulifera solaris]